MLVSFVISVAEGSYGFGTLFILLLGYAMFMTALFRRCYLRQQARTWGFKAQIGLGWLICLPLGVFLIVQLLIATAGQWYRQDISPSYLVVPGAGIIRREPSFTLAKRLDTAIEYMSTNTDIKVVLTGGQAEGQLASEAQVMAWYMENRQIPLDQMLLEEKATNTMENILFSKKLIEAFYHMPLEEVVVVTSDYHLLRAQMLGRRVGLRVLGVASPSPPSLYQQYAVREFFAIFKSMVFDWP